MCQNVIYIKGFNDCLKFLTIVICASMCGNLYFCFTQEMFVFFDMWPLIQYLFVYITFDLDCCMVEHIIKYQKVLEFVHILRDQNFLYILLCYLSY